jgi:hypothetical protein
MSSRPAEPDRRRAALLLLASVLMIAFYARGQLAHTAAFVRAWLGP